MFNSLTKYGKALVISVILVLVAIGCLVGAITTKINQYTVSGIVSGVDGRVITVTTVNGDMFSYVGDENKNQIVKLLMDNNGTPNDNTDDRVMGLVG